jgi:hypothetical protein
LICCLFNLSFAFGQNGILLDKNIEPDHDLIFTSTYIQQYQLGSTVADFLDKKDGELLRDYQKKMKIVYNEQGLCKSKLYTFPSVYGNIFTTAKVRDGRVLKREQALVYDSLMHFYFYNDKGLYTKTVQGNGLQFYNYLYAYDSAGQVKAEKKIYEVCKVFSDGVCEPEHQKLLYEAYYKTTFFDRKQSKTIVYNDEKRPYKEIIRNYNEKGQILSEQEEFLLSPFYTKYVWQYNNKNELTSKTYFKEEKEQWKMVFEYDDNSRLNAEKVYKLGVFTNEIMYVYELSNGVLNSYINRDVLNKTMQIVKLNYGLRY